MKFFGAFLLTVVISISVWGQARDLQLDENIQPEVPKIEEAKTSSLDNSHSISVGVTLQNYRYEEVGLISHTGILIGAWLNWFYQIPEYSVYNGRVMTEFNTGQLDYDGALCDINTNECSVYKSKTNELTLRASHRFTFRVFDGIQIFFGIGYRYLFDKGEGVGFYRRVGQYWILPVGFTMRIPWNEFKVHVLFDLEYDFFLKGQIESKLSDVNSSFSDVTHRQNKGKAVCFTLGFEPSATTEEPRPLMFYLFYENWSIPKSDREELKISGAPSGNFFYEPENHSNAYGLKVGWSY